MFNSALSARATSRQFLHHHLVHSSFSDCPLYVSPGHYHPPRYNITTLQDLNPQSFKPHGQNHLLSLDQTTSYHFSPIQFSFDNHRDEICPEIPLHPPQLRALEPARLRAPTKIQHEGGTDYCQLAPGECSNILGRLSAPWERSIGNRWRRQSCPSRSRIDP